MSGLEYDQHSSFSLSTFPKVKDLPLTRLTMSEAYKDNPRRSKRQPLDGFVSYSRPCSHHFYSQCYHTAFELMSETLFISILDRCTKNVDTMAALSRGQFSISSTCSYACTELLRKGQRSQEDGG